jgi:hypothetical protein
MVTGLRALAGAAPRGECELRLTWATGRATCDRTGDDEHIGNRKAEILEGVRRVFTSARDMALTAEWWIWGYRWVLEIPEPSGRGVRKRIREPSLRGFRSL